MAREPRAELSPPPSRSLGRYRVLEVLGEGGMGTVHLGVAPDGSLVALKVLRTGAIDGAVGRAGLAAEVAAIQRVRSPRVAEVLDFEIPDEAGAEPWLVLRYVPGPSLSDVVTRNGPLAPEALTRLADGLAEALAAVHAAGLVHRDVKPGNVLLAPDGPVLIDFGLAEAGEVRGVTGIGGTVYGTPAFMAPETLTGAPAVPATDVHGWAGTLVFAATGAPPYGRGQDADVLDRIRAGALRLAPMPQLGSRLEALVRAGLATEPGRRPGVRELRGAAAGRPSAPTPPPPRTVTTAAEPRLVPRGAPRPLLLALALLLVVGVMAAPLVTLLGVGVGGLLARTSWRVRLGVAERRLRRGERRGDLTMGWLRAPGYLLASVPVTAWQLLLASAAAAATWGVAQVVADERLAWLAAGVVGLLVVWLGPTSRRLRAGTGVVLGSVARPGWATWLLVLATLLAGWLLGGRWLADGTTWWPA